MTRAIRGLAGLGRRAYVLVEDLALVLPPRTGKSAALAGRIPGHPGPVLVISASPDLYEPGKAGGAS